MSETLHGISNSLSTADILKLHNMLKPIKVPIFVRINSVAYLKLRSICHVNPEPNKEIRLFGLSVGIDNFIPDDKARISYSNGEEKEITLFEH